MDPLTLEFDGVKPLEFGDALEVDQFDASGRSYIVVRPQRTGLAPGDMVDDDVIRAWVERGFDPTIWVKAHYSYHTAMSITAPRPLQIMDEPIE